MLGQEILLTISSLKIADLAQLVVKNSDKEKSVYSGYGITFDSAGSRILDNGTARNIIFSTVDNSSLSHADNRKNSF